MWAGLLLGLAVYVLFGVAPAAGNLLVSLTNYSGLIGSSTSFTWLANYRAPIVLGVTIVGLIWILLFNPSEGPAASVFGAFGIHSSFFGSDGAAMPLVIGVQIWQNLGFSTLVFIGGLRSINPEIYEAANLDGVRPWRRLRRITFPLLAPAVTVNILLALVGSFTTYNLIYVLTDGLYGTDTLGMLAFNAAFGPSANLGYGAAVSIVLFAMTLIVALPAMAWLRWRERRLLA
jgi:raffinose/stachyose/melibiose transport system permease protein